METFQVWFNHVPPQANMTDKEGNGQLHIVLPASQTDKIVFAQKFCSNTDLNCKKIATIALGYFYLHLLSLDKLHYLIAHHLRTLYTHPLTKIQIL